MTDTTDPYQLANDCICVARVGSVRSMGEKLDQAAGMIRSQATEIAALKAQVEALQATTTDPDFTLAYMVGRESKFDDAAIQRAADAICDDRWEDDVSCEDLARAAIAALHQAK